MAPRLTPRAETLTGRLLPCAVSVTATCAFFIDVCAWVFDCGCRSLWAGADIACNVHNVQPPHCPFCRHGIPGYTAVMAVVCLPQLAVSLRGPWSRMTRLLACLALFPATMFAVGLLLGWVEGYW
jgi:hypothetical protein